MLESEGAVCWYDAERGGARKHGQVGLGARDCSSEKCQQQESSMAQAAANSDRPESGTPTAAASGERAVPAAGGAGSSKHS